MNIAFRADASAQIGTGHVVRCLTLARALQRIGAHIRFVCRHITPFLQAEIEKARLELVILPPASGTNGDGAYAAWLGTSQGRDAAETRLAMKDRHWDWLIVDHYALDARWETALRPACGKLLAVDDLANRPHDCDALLDQNLALSCDRYDQLAPKTCRRFEGPRYALLRSEFLQARDQRARADIERRLNIFFGGTDPAGATLMALDVLAVMSDQRLAVDVITGSDNPHREDIGRRCAALAGASLHVQPPSIADLFSRATLGLGAGGTASWERCCTGLPTIIVSTAENQLAGSAALARARAAIDMGPLECLSPEKLSAMLSRLMAKPWLLGAMRRRAAALVDGRGTERMCLYLMRETVQLRPARPEDAQQAWQWRNDRAIRRHSFDPTPLSWAGHSAWWADAIRSGTRYLLIAFCGGYNVGVLRFDTDGEEAVVSIYLDPGLAGLGLGHTVLRKGEAWLRAALPAIRIIRAEILSANRASSSSFEAAGYRRDEERPVWIRTLAAQ